ncbi:hypothetical protein CEXT_305691 [Caerostris extrusa]|uniref:Uncharacterized protein n=1 Tax=Caerostris extrusa TaxID=172846 RepID=A0AAV4W2S3_CAEEX|nr:hypothetical protein CEXT_305691 [Caerostris extrusa]
MALDGLCGYGFRWCGYVDMALEVVMWLWDMALGGYVDMALGGYVDRALGGYVDMALNSLYLKIRYDRLHPIYLLHMRNVYVYVCKYKHC